MSDLELKALMTTLSFSADAQQTFLNALARIQADKTAAAWFDCLLKQYNETEDCNYKQMLADVTAMGAVLGIHEYTITMLLYLCMADKLKERYTEQGIDDSIFFNTMSDLRYKSEECRFVHGIDGFFASMWFAGFFRMSRFALNRLQFEIVTTTNALTADGITVPAGTKAINIHIPRTGGKLDHDEVLKSYQMAADWFAPQFENQPIIFICTTWLLDPWNMTVLSPTSNLAAFYNDFRIIKTGTYPDYNQAWRLFDCKYTGNPADLPRNSSLRRAYAERIERGEPMGWATGIFVYHDGQVSQTL